MIWFRRHVCAFVPSLRGFRPRAAALCALILILSAAPASAQTSDRGDPRKGLTQYKVDTWQTEQGLPLNTVQALLQTRDGYLWVGTAAGLARFDGLRFTTYDSAEVPEVSSRPVFGLFEDSEKNLWIGHSGGASIYRDGVFKGAIGRDLMEGRRVWAFAQSSDGAVWAATENGLMRWEKGIIKVYKQTDGLPTNRLRTLAFDGAGTLWIGTTGGGLVSFANGKFETFDASKGFPHTEVRSVLPDPKGGIWAATAGGGLVHVIGGASKIYRVADGLPTDQLTSLALDARGSLWIGTWGSGVTRMSEGRFSSIASAGGLAGDQIWSIAADREGSVWIGTWVGGLNRLRNRAFVVFGVPEGLSSDNVRSVIHARDGSAWVSTSGGGVNRIEGATVTSIGKKNGLPTDEASTLLEDRDGSIWIGTYTAGVTRFKDGRLETFGTAQGLPNMDVRVLFQDKAGTVWVGTRASPLAKFDGKAFVTVHGGGAPVEGVSTILEGRDRTLWFGTPGQGLFRYRSGVFEAVTRKEGLVSNWIMSLYEDAAGSLWIGTNGEGMNRLRDGRVTPIRTSDGLWDGGAQVIIEDRAGYLWMTSNRGFYRVARADMDAFANGTLPKVTSVGYGPGDTLRSTSFAGGLQPAGAIDSAGHIWLPSSNGVVIVDPQHLPGSDAPPAVSLEDVTVNGVNVPVDSGVVLPPGSLPLSIRYAAMTLLNADRARYRYQMEGLTHDWVEADENREASFPALPHGAYVFRVAASIDGKRWSETPATLNITVQPRLYQTPWFLALAILATIAAIIGLIRLRTHEIQKRHAEMERLVAEKTEELRLANERLSRLSFVDALTGVANRRRFDETLETEWRRAIRSQNYLAVVMIDIDEFKPYNDALGHPEGDKCLVAVADVIQNSVGRAGDLAARYGGEEFVVLIPSADRDAALAFAEKVRHACEARAIPHPASAVGSVVTISVGVASCIPTEETTTAALMSEADVALYRAKQEGRNRVS